MNTRLRRRIASAVAMGVAAASLSGCAAAPNMDGGIVGTGNQVDCERRLKKDGTAAPLPAECRGQAVSR